MAAGITALAAAAPLQAHVPGAAVGSGNPDLIAILLVVATALYTIGVARLWSHVRAKRELVGRAAAFAAGCAALGWLLLGPVDGAAPGSFAIHMIQHEGLMLIAAPLLVIGRGLPLFLWALPRSARLRLGQATRADPLRRCWRVLTAPLAAWLLHAVALWSWHAPPLFNAALRDPVLHQWQHVSFFASALIFWHALLRRSGHGAQGMALLYLFTTTIHTGVLGALITLAHRPVYASMQDGLLGWWGLTPLEDQQLGGLIMWVPGALVYVGMALWLLARWIGPERASQPSS